MATVFPPGGAGDGDVALYCAALISGALDARTEAQRQESGEVAGLEQALNEALEGDGGQATAQKLVRNGQLLSLADRVAALAAHVTSDATQLELPPHTQGIRASCWMTDWLRILTQAVYCTTRLLRHALPHCQSQAQRERVLAAVAILPQAGTATVRLAPSRLPSVTGSELYFLAYDHCLSTQLFLATEVLKPGGAAAHVLPPDALLGWLRQAVQGLEEFQATKGLTYTLCLDGLFMVLAAVAEEGRQPYQAALVADPQLLRRLAELTAASHAALPRWLYRPEAGPLARSKLVAWVGSWGRLADSMDQGQRQVLLPTLQTAGGRILTAEARQVLRMQLPVPPAQLSQSAMESWQVGIAAVSQLSIFLLTSSTHPAGMRERQIFLTVAKSAPAIARFFGAVVAGQLAAGASAGGQGRQLAAGFGDWGEACTCACAKLALGPNDNDGQRQKEVAAAIDLAHALTWLLPQLPQLAHVLNGGSSSSACPAQGCTCAACRAEEGHITVDGFKLLFALVQCLAASLSSHIDGPAELVPHTDQLVQLHTNLNKLPHALRQLSACQLALAGLAEQDVPADSQAGAGGGGGADEGRNLLSDSAATWLRLGLPAAARITLWALQGSKPPEQDRDAAAAWDRRYACCLLEAAAASAAVEQSCHEQHKLGRQGTLNSLREAAQPWQEDEHAAAAAAPEPLSEADWLAKVASGLLDPASAAHLALLLQQLLPPPADGDAANGSPSVRACRPPIEAAVFQAQALSRRRCAYLRCSNLSGDSFGDFHASKRCGGCRLVRYCCADHQDADWRSHKAPCKALVAAAAAAQ